MKRRGKGEDGKPGLIESTAKWVVWLVILLAVPLFICGVLLAFYFPAVPFINWLAAILGWLVLLVEAVITAPFWAAAHAVGAGGGMAGQHAKQGYMLILSLVSRPVLMIAGLFGAFLVMHYACKFLLYSFVPFMQGMNAGSLSGVVTFIAMCVLLAGLSLIIANRAWSLIYALPDRVLAWIGAHSPQLGEQEMNADSRQMFIAAVSAGSKSGGGAMEQLVESKKGTDGQNTQKKTKGERDVSNQDQGEHDNDALRNRKEEEKLLPGNIKSPKQD